MHRTALTAILLALASALFFTLTYVLNRAMAQEGMNWAWMVILRYVITLPLLALVMPLQGGLGQLPAQLRRHAGVWLLWSGVGFGLFGVCLTWAAASGPSWLIAGSFQITVIAGVLMSPFIYRDARRRIPRPALGVGVLVVIGVLLMQIGQASGWPDAHGWLALASVIVAAFAYPLGNRMILLHLERSGGTLNATQRVFGMTLMSQPVWLVLAWYAFDQAGWPGATQFLLPGAIALSAGVIATVLFFQATAMVRNDTTALAAVEAMQAAEILFTTLLGVSFLGEDWPRGPALVGAVVIIIGIVLFSRLSARRAAGDDRATRELRGDRGA